MEGKGSLKVYAVILAGGGGRRLWGDGHTCRCGDGRQHRPRHVHCEKPLVTVGGKPMLLRVYEVVSRVAERVAVAAPAPLVYEVYKPVLEDLGVYADVLEDACAGRSCGPLAGILAGLRWAPGRDVFVVAGDMPFVDPRVVKLLADEAAALRHRAALVPRWRKGVEPLHAVYRRESLPVIERALAEFDGRGGRPRLVDVLEKANAAFIDMERRFEPEELELAFANVNTPEDLERVRSIAGKES